MVRNCKLGYNVKILYPDLVNLYDCEIRDNTVIGPFVEIQAGVRIGYDCKIQSHTFICSGVEIGDRVFIGHGVIFVNDKHPQIYNPTWVPSNTYVKDRVVIGSNATILPVTLGRGCSIGAGAVVVKDVPQFSKVAGNPAKEIL